MKQDLYNDDYINIDGNYIHKTAIVHSNVKIGKGNIIGAYTVIGSNGEIRLPKDFEGSNIDFQKSFKGMVRIGDNNVISELVTIQRPYVEGEATYIGSNNIIMAHSHIGHNAFIGNGCEICSGSVIGGYAMIKDGAMIKLNATIRNRVVVGLKALVGFASAVAKDVADGIIVYGNPAKQNK